MVADTDCYVYVVNVGPDHVPVRLFPNGDFDQIERCRANVQYDVPNGSDWLTLDDNAGLETTYLIASTDRVSALEGLRTPNDDSGRATVGSQCNRKVGTSAATTDH